MSEDFVELRTECSLTSDSVKEYLGQTIQAGGGTVGHSSVEDSVATLDLVRWHVLNRPPPSAKPTTSAAAVNKL